MKPNETAANASTVAANFINQYGKARFKRFLKLVQQNVSGEEIATEFDVSRERVRQWKNAFGCVIQSYDISPDILKLAGMK